MSAPALAERAAELVRVRVISPTFGYASIRAGGWSVGGIVVQRIGDNWRVCWPSVESGGQRWQVCTPPPEVRERLEAELLAAFQTAFQRVDARGGRA